MPQSLADWRSQAQAGVKTKYEPYDFWRSLVPYFQKNGLTLWETASSYPGVGYFLVEPKGVERVPDGFSYLSEYYPDGSPTTVQDFFQQVVRHCSVPFAAVFSHPLCALGICDLRTLSYVLRAQMMVGMS